MKSLSEILEFLYADEKSFVDEIDRVENTPEKVSLIPEDCLAQGGGWLYTIGEEGSGDWNLARMIGSPDSAFRFLSFLPQSEVSLLLPKEIPEQFLKGLKLQSNLLYFADKPLSETVIADEDRKEALLTGHDFQIKIRNLPGGDSGLAEPLLDGVYLLNKNMIKAYVKVVRRSRNFNEVYIEVEPALRCQGIGCQLLRTALTECRKRAKTLVYAVDQANFASVATAEKAGLKQFMTLLKA